MSSTKSPAAPRARSSLRKVRFGSSDGDHDSALRSRRRSPAPHRSPSRLCDEDLRDRAFSRISAPNARAALRDRLGDRSGPALGEPPGAERAVDLAHVVVQQHVRRPGGPRTHERADDPARRLRRLEHVGLEPLVEKIGGAHRHQLVERVEMLLARATEMLAELEQSSRSRRRRATSDRAGPCRGSASPPSPCGASAGRTRRTLRRPRRMAHAAPGGSGRDRPRRRDSRR